MRGLRACGVSFGTCGSRSWLLIVASESWCADPCDSGVISLLSGCCLGVGVVFSDLTAWDASFRREDSNANEWPWEFPLVEL